MIVTAVQVNWADFSIRALLIAKAVAPPVVDEVIEEQAKAQIESKSFDPFRFYANVATTLAKRKF